MEYHELYVLGIALVLSGIIAFKTFQWVLYEEISAGVAALFFGFAIAVFFAVNNYAVVRHWGLLNEKQLSTIRETIGAASEKSIALINAEFQKHNKAVQPMAKNAERVAEASNGLAEKAQERAWRALEIARDAKVQFEKMGSIQAWATWELLMEKFLDIESYLTRWEEKNGLVRDTPGADSMTELAKKLDALDGQLPETIRALYFERQRKYEILTKMKEAFQLSSFRFAQADLILPERPKLPSSLPPGKELLTRNKK
ncbi:MAG: hypothetical protein P8175_09665 [Deltaproteobacteria bacterium]